MEFIKKFKVVIAIVLIILVLVLIRSTDKYHFKKDSEKLAEASITKSNRLSIDQAGTIPGKHLIINLDKEAIGTTGLTGIVQNIPPDSILDKKNVDIFLKNEGHIFLLSAEPGLSARIWMILSQLGYKNIYILTKNDDSEVLKYKFRPDTLRHRPE
jgi:hypothetical protein